MSNNTENNNISSSDTIKIHANPYLPLLLLFLKISALGMLFVFGIAFEIGMKFSPLIDKIELLTLIGFYSSLVVAGINILYAFTKPASLNVSAIPYSGTFTIIFVMLSFLYMAIYFAPLITLISASLFLIGAIIYIVILFCALLDQSIIHNREHSLNNSNSLRSIISYLKIDARFIHTNTTKILAVHYIWAILVTLSFLSGTIYVKYLKYIEPQFVTNLDIGGIVTKKEITILLPANNGWIVFNKNSTQTEFISNDKISSIYPRVKIRKDEYYRQVELVKYFDNILKTITSFRNMFKKSTKSTSENVSEDPIPKTQ